MKPLHPVGTLWPHTLPPPPNLREYPTVFDIGAGVRPMTWYKPRRHVCVEPYGPYADVLKAHGYEVWPVTALTALYNLKAEPVAIYLLDVIEHMERDEALRVLELAQEIADEIVVYTPLGFLPQTTDEWGYGGDDWQTHRSGWSPADFPGWEITHYLRGFYAVWRA